MQFFSIGIYTHKKGKYIHLYNYETRRNQQSLIHNTGADPGFLISEGADLEKNVLGLQKKVKK